MKNKFNKPRTFQRRKSADYMDNTKFDAKGTPGKEGSLNVELSVKALRNLPKSSYSFMADPYTASLPKSTPYAILNTFNKTVGGTYRGVKNLDGGNVQQYTTAINSGLLKYSDFIRTSVETNYRYIPSVIPKGANLNKYPGKNLIDEQIKSITEGLSQLKSTTFTQMDIYNYCVETDMPMGSVQPVDIDLKDKSGTVTTIKGYTGLSAVLYAMSRFYQIIILDSVNCVNWHNSFRLKMGTMIRSAWNREVSELNGLFGLFKKKSFLSLLDSLCLSFEGEYVDTQFMQQTNALNLVPSRRSDSITDPVLEILMTYSKPTKFNMYYKLDSDSYAKEPIFSYENDFTVAYNHPDFSGVNVPAMSFSTAINDWMVIFSAEDTMKWARSTPYSDDVRFNNAKWRLDVINECLTKFKIAFTDFRQVIDTIQPVGLNNWTHHFRPNIVKDTDSPMLRNLLVDNIYAIAFGGATEINFDSATKRWRTFSMWNMYDGIPEYDTYSGGSFLTFSLKTINASQDYDDVLNYLPIGVIPVFGQETSTLEMRAVDRLGNETVITPEVINMRNNPIYSRLVPLLSQSDLNIRVPSVTLATTDITSLQRKSCLYKTIMAVTGFVKIGDDYGVDPDVISVYQIEVEDVTNDAISYARGNAFFKGTSDRINEFGFA